MKLLIKLIILIFLTCKVQSGYGSDSTYIKLAWSGDVDKPYHEFLFYKSGSVYPDQNGNSFAGIYRLTNEQFHGLKTLLTDNFIAREKKPSSNEPCTNYFIGFFTGRQLISSANILNQEDLIHVSRLMKNFFKETNLSKEINTKWEEVFGRLGIKEI